jgi:hypothetical protein
VRVQRADVVHDHIRLMLSSQLYPLKSRHPLPFSFRNLPAPANPSLPPSQST